MISFSYFTNIDAIVLIVRLPDMVNGEKRGTPAGPLLASED